MKNNEPVAETKSRRNKKRLAFLVAVLVLLLIGIWLFDKPSPAHPNGRIDSALLLTIIAVCVTLFVVWILKAARPKE